MPKEKVTLTLGTGQIQALHSLAMRGAWRRRSTERWVLVSPGSGTSGLSTGGLESEVHRRKSRLAHARATLESRRSIVAELSVEFDDQIRQMEPPWGVEPLVTPWIRFALERTSQRDNGAGNDLVVVWPGALVAAAELIKP